MSRFATIVVALACTALVFAGCSSGSSPSSSASSTTTSLRPSSGDPELERTVRAYGAAMFSGDAATVWAMQSARCKQVNQEPTMAGTVATLTSIHGQQEMVSYTQQEDGGVGVATYEFRAPYLGQEDERWVMEEGTWHNDDCPIPRPDDGREPFAPR